jgi:F-type H+-transporting ATPase subunit epsilon
VLSLSLVTPAKKLFTDLQVEEVFVPSYKGELNVLDGHGPLMASLASGVLRYRKPGDGKLEVFAISWGYLEISGNRVTVLAETAEAAHEIDVARAQLAKEQSEKNLLKTDAGQEDFQKYQMKLERALIRLEVAKQAGINMPTGDFSATAEKRFH